MIRVNLLKGHGADAKKPTAEPRALAWAWR